MNPIRRSRPRPRGRAARWVAGGLLAAGLLLALLALPVLLGWLEGPRFPILDPSPWEGLKQYGRNLTFRR